MSDSWTPDLPSTEEVLSSLFTSALPPLPPQESHVGPVLATWWETEPGIVYVHAEGGTPDDRHYASVITRIQLEGHGYRHAQFELDASAAPEPPNYRKATGPERCGGCKMFDHGECWGYGNKQVEQAYVCDSFAAGRSSSVHTASWVDIMNKAKRLIASGQVQLLRNGFNYIVGHVVGDHGSYETELSRDDPNSRAITSWQCTCPWDQYAWQRTRKWKRLEGRPCAHVLGLFWKALSTPLDDDVTPEQKEQLGTGQKLTPDAPPVPEHPPEIEDRLQKGEEAPPEDLPRSFSPEGEIIQGDQGQLPGMPPDATGGPPGPAQAPLAPPPSGPTPPGILPAFPGAQQEMPWGGPGTTPGGMKSPPGAFTVPGAKPQTPANPIQNPSTYSSVQGATSAWDPTICEQCGGAMSEPRQVGSRWMNHCVKCGHWREVSSQSPLLRQQQQNWPPYPEALAEVGQDRAWVARTAAGFSAPQPVRAKKPLMGLAEGPVPGQYGDGTYMEIPAGTRGEVYHQDESTGWIEVAFDLPESGPHEPYRVRVYAEPGDIEAAGDLTPSDPAIRRKTHTD